MAKAVLVMDMPESCEECPFCNDDADCNVLERPIDVDFMLENPEWCPLRPVPEKKQNACTHGFAAGWNACIDAINGNDDVD